MRKDKLIAEIIFTLLIFSVIYVFSNDISSYFDEIESSTDIKPVQSLFWFLELFFDLLGHWLFTLIAAMIVIGILYLIENRKR